jgi:CRISPR-associated protein Csm3
MAKLSKHIELVGDLVVKTGLRIGAGGSGLEIGGLDNPIVRHPESKIPYVPGSSLKGKLRSLLETTGFQAGSFPPPQPSSGPCGCNRCIVCRLFGCGDPKMESSPSRLVFRDCPVQQESLDRLTPLLAEGVFYSEVKAEVVMDRNSGKVGGAGPRSMDRIAAGTRLDFRVTVRVFEGDDEELFKGALLHAIGLLEKEGLGGSVTRGYGQVAFENLTWDGKPIDRTPKAN